MVPLPTVWRWLLPAAFLGVSTAFAQTSVQWNLAGNGAWFTSSNWNGTLVPSTSHRATINTANTITASGSTAVSVGAIDVTAAGAQLIFNYSSSSLGLTLGSYASSWSNGTVQFSTANGINGNGRTNTTLTVGSGAQVLFDTLTGTRYTQNIGLTNGGTIANTTGTLSFYNDNVTNQAGGLIHANGAAIDFAGNTTLVNSGTLRATGSGASLTFAGTQTTANLGTVDLVSCAHAYLTGTVTNTAATLNAPSGGSFELRGGTVNGGTIASGALTFTNYGGLVNGATLAGAFTLPSSSYVTFSGSAGLGGTAASLGNSSTLYWKQVGTLTGQSISFGSGSRIYVQNANNTLTFDSATTASGEIEITSDGSSGGAFTNLGTLNQTTGSGQLYAASVTNGGAINISGGSYLELGYYYSPTTLANSSTGTMTVDGASSALYIDGNLANAGTLIAQNSGQIIFRTGSAGVQTTANLGTIQITNSGHVYLEGTLDNLNATLTAPTGGKYELRGGTINNGSIGSGALTYTNSGGTLNGVTLLENLSLPSGTNVSFSGGTAFDPSVTTLSLGSSSTVNWSQVGTLSGKALTFGSGSALYVTGGNHTLTLANSVTASGDIELRSDGSAGTAVTNQGTLNHTTGSGTIYANSFTNSGTITASNGTTLDIGYYYSPYSITNTSGGSITADGTNTSVYLEGNFANQGTLSATNAGRLIFRSGYAGSLTTANIGNVQLATGGRVLLNGNVDNSSATLTAPSGGKFELYGGTISSGSIGPGALTYTSSGGTLNGVTLLENLVLPGSTSVVFSGGTTLDPTTSAITLGTYANLDWQQTGTVTGKTITFGSGSSFTLSGVNRTLTLSSSVTGTGDIDLRGDGSSGNALTNQGTLNNNSGSGQIYAKTFSNNGSITASAGSTLEIGYYYSPYSLTNASGATITSDGTSTALYINGNLANLGTLTAQNAGQIIFRTGYADAQTTANLGSIQIANGGHVYLAGTLDNTSATLTAPSGGTFELRGGQINNGTIANGALTFTNYGGTLNALSVLGNLTLPTSSSVTLTGNTTLDPTSTTLTLGNSAGVYWQQIGNITGKTIAFGSGGFIELSGGNNTLTLTSSVTGSGEIDLRSDGSLGTTLTNQGTLNHTSGSGQIYARSFNNSGSITATSGYLDVGYYYAPYSTTNASGGAITADGASTIVYLNGNVANQGTLTAQNSGALVFRTGYGNAQTTANLGSIQIASGGHVYLDGDLDNTSATLTAPSGGQYELHGGTVSNGTIANGALTFTNYGGNLTSTSLLGNLTLPASTHVTLTGNTTLDPTSTSISLASNAGFYWKQLGSVIGKTIGFGSGAFIQVTGANNNLTLGSTVTATGDIDLTSDGSSNTSITNQGTLNHTTGSGRIYAPAFTNSGNITVGASSNLELGYYYSNYGVTNGSGGNITADGSNAIVYIDGNLDNQGTLTATNSGQLVFRTGYSSPQTTGRLGNIQISNNGHAYLNGTLDNSNATLTAPAGGKFELYGGTINDGSVAANALAFTPSGGTLNHVTLLGGASLPNSSYAYFTNGTNLAANSGLTLGNSARVFWQQVGALTGSTLTFGSSSYIYVTGTNNSLTLDSATTGSGQVQIYSDSYAGTAITNNGTLTHTGSAGNLYAMSFTNNGVIASNGGTMYLGVTWTGSSFVNNPGAVLRANGGDIWLQTPTASPLNNQGIIDLQSGTFYTNNRLTNAAGGTVRGAGIINGDLIMAGGVIEPGNGGIGNLRINSGTLTVTGPSTLSIEINGATADALVFQSPTSNIDLGAGLLTLSLTLLAAPTPNTTFNLISITSGSKTIGGTFAGLSTSGSTLTASFAGNPFTFSVTYSPTLVSLSYNAIMVPEPSTYALLGTGLVLLGWTHRRRRRGERNH